MDLKLKDEITKLLIEHPGLSVRDLAKKTGNYYSYTHKLLKEMESLDLVEIGKVKKGKREITVCNLKQEYKSKWVSDLKKFVKSILKDAEVKAAFLVTYLFVLLNYFKTGEGNSATMLAQEASLKSAPITDLSQTTAFKPELFVIIIVPLLFVIWIVRTRFYKKRA